MVAADKAEQAVVQGVQTVQTATRQVLEVCLQLTAAKRVITVLLTEQETTALAMPCSIASAHLPQEERPFPVFRARAITLTVAAVALRVHGFVLTTRIPQVADRVLKVL